MPLIEGIGDEVTLLLGVFVIAVILLFAWLSTHTSDIPLLRDVGVIVVELSQRRVRHQNEDAPVDAANSNISESTVDSNDALVPSSEAAAGENLGSADPENHRVTVESDSESKEASVVNNHASTSNASSNHETQDSLAEEVQQCDNQNIENAGHIDSGSQEIESLVPKASVVVEETQGGLHVTSEEEHPSEEEVRRRRVQYFNTAHSPLHPETQPSNQVSSDNKETSNPVTSKTPDSVPLAESSNRHNNTNNVSTPTPLDNSSPSSSQSHSPSQSPSPSRDVQQASEGTSVSRIRVKLKYMNETQRLVYANPFDTIGDFRRNHFQSELEDNKWVRFIYNGQDLRDDGRTLQACNVSDNCTMHCLITTQTRTNASTAASHDSEEDTFMGALMYPLFTFVLLVVWYFRLTYRQYFSAMSTICLIGITFLLILSYVSTLRRPQQQAPAQDNRNSETQNHQHVE